MQIVRGNCSRSARPTALTIGNFDGVHLGHLALLAQLREAAAHRRIPSSVLTFEPHPREFFSPASAPARLTSFREKVRLLAQCNVDRLYVQRFDSTFSQLSAGAFVNVLDLLGTCFLLVGDDFRFGRDRMGDFSFLESARKNFDLGRMGSVRVGGERVSSSAIRAALAKGDFAKAKSLLGRDYSISGKVTHGAKLGAKLGFPTANVHLNNSRPPLFGIFVVEVALANQARLPGVASLGVRPTIVENGAPTLEVHLFDFSHDLYGERITVFFLHKLRDEAKYAGLETLGKQIDKDVENAKAYFRDQRPRTRDQGKIF
jgi:riboflavin kinase / FMN adenylyltransferase